MKNTTLKRLFLRPALLALAGAAIFSLSSCTNVSARSMLESSEYSQRKKVDEPKKTASEKVKDLISGKSVTPSDDTGIQSTGTIPEDELYRVISAESGFTEQELYKAMDSYISLSKLDALGRAGIAEGSFCGKDMKYDGREDISTIFPSGWKQASYDTSVTHSDVPELMNRCHLLMEALSDNSDPENLVSGTRQMNAFAMLPWETKITDFIEQHPDTHVLYRVTPDFRGEELLCRGILMQAQSVEDNGEGLSFKVYCYNEEHGIKISYDTGESREK